MRRWHVQRQRWRSECQSLPIVSCWHMERHAGSELCCSVQSMQARHLQPISALLERQGLLALPHRADQPGGVRRGIAVHDVLSCGAVVLVRPCPVQQVPCRDVHGSEAHAKDSERLYALPEGDVRSLGGSGIVRCVPCRNLERLGRRHQVGFLPGLPSGHIQQKPGVHISGLLQRLQCGQLRLQPQHLRAVPAWQIQQRDRRY